MAHVLTMPEVAAAATEAVVADWLVAEGDDFAVGQAIVAVETEKALVDVEAEADGVLLAVLVPGSSTVAVGSPIAVIGDPGEQVDDLPALLAELGVSADQSTPAPERRDVPEPGDERSAPETGQTEPAPETTSDPEPLPATESLPTRRADSAGGRERRTGRVFASPLARKLARQAGLRVEDLSGTGPQNRILRRDVEAAVAERDSAERDSAERDSAERDSAEPAAAAVPAASPAPSPAPSAGSFAAHAGLAGRAEPDVVEHSRLRRAVASRLTRSKQEAPHFYLRATVLADRLLALREELNAGAQTKVSVNDLVVKAVGAAHRRVPELNVEWTADALRVHHTVDVAVAVATERGLLTPVVRDVADRSVGSIAEAVRELAGRAREGKLRQEELEGGTISVTNLGMFGVEEFAAIINPPHAAILAVGAVAAAPAVMHGEVVVAQQMRLTLAVDHRPVDGVVAARWLAALVEQLENPVALLR